MSLPFGEVVGHCGATREVQLRGQSSKTDPFVYVQYPHTLTLLPQLPSMLTEVFPFMHVTLFPFS